MHELGMIQRLMNLVLTKAQEAWAKKVVKIARSTFIHIAQKKRVYRYQKHL